MHFTEEIHFVGNLGILIIFRHIGLVNYLQTLVSSSQFKDIVGILDKNYTT